MTNNVDYLLVLDAQSGGPRKDCDRKEDMGLGRYLADNKELIMRESQAR